MYEDLGSYKEVNTQKLKEGMTHIVVKLEKFCIPLMISDLIDLTKYNIIRKYLSDLVFFPAWKET